MNHDTKPLIPIIPNRRVCQSSYCNCRIAACPRGDYNDSLIRGKGASKAATTKGDGALQYTTGLRQNNGRRSEEGDINTLGASGRA